MSDPDASDRAAAAVAADLLAHGGPLNRLSMTLTAASIVALPIVAMIRPSQVAMALITLAVVAGLAELWFALRIGFDARAFQRLARGDTAGGLTLSAFDSAMRTLELVPEDKVGRPIAERVRGAMRLLGRQVGLLVLQAVLLVAGGWVLAAVRG